MKKMKIQVLLMIVLLCQGLPMRGMLPQAARQAGRRSPLVVTPAKSQTTWQQRLRWFSGSPRQEVPKQEPPAKIELQTAPSPFTSPLTSPQRVSFFDRIKSFFASTYFAQPRTELTLEEIDGLLRGHPVEDSDRGVYLVFGDEDLKIAMEKIGGMIESNNEYKHAIVQELEFLHRFATTKPKLTLLDKVFHRLFFKDTKSYGRFHFMIPSDSTINYMKLAKYLIDKGALINPDNYDMYKRIYFELLMLSYKRLYTSNPETTYGAEYEIQKFKEIFKELDPVLEKIIPGFKNELETAQREREAIELNPEAYKEKLEEEQKAYREKLIDEENRSKYRSIKSEKVASYMQRFGYLLDKSHFIDKVKFDEEEYQAWLKSGKNSDYISSQISLEEAKEIAEKLKNRYYGKRLKQQRATE